MKPHVISIGVEAFDQALIDTQTPYIHLDWRPPAAGDTELVGYLFDLKLKFRAADGSSLIDKANEEALHRIQMAQPMLKRVQPAHELIPNMTKNSIFHAGPPIHWKDMCGPMRGAFLGAIIYEGLAKTEAEAEAMMDNDEISYGPNHAQGSVGPMTGIISYSMPLWVVENVSFGNMAYCTINEGIGKVMRFGANGPDVIARLKWIEECLAPVLDKALILSGGINLKNIVAQALAMGDEMHQRNVAASLAFYKSICGELAECGADRKITEFLAKSNEQFFLNLAMVVGKATMDPVRNIPYCTVITAMSRNGVNFGINVSALGDEWFTAPCLNPQALYFPGYTAEDANPDMGDSSIVECYGLGGFAMAAAPAVVRFVGGGSLEDALNYSHEMRKITVGTNMDLPIPNLNFAGVPSGIDVRKVVETGILPVINTGVAHRLPGIGQVGAGIVTPPMDIMTQALGALHAKFVSENT